MTSAPETFVARKPAIRFTANFEKNLEEIERFLIEAEAPQTYDALLDELLEAVTPNLERFPGMGRPFMLCLPRSVETTNALAAQTYDALLDELLEAVTPNLERFPGMGRPFMLCLPRSVETTNALAALCAKLLALTTDPEALREYVLKDYLLLYAQIGGAIHLLAIRHQQQLSFDFAGHWR